MDDDEGCACATNTSRANEHVLRTPRHLSHCCTMQMCLSKVAPHVSAHPSIHTQHTHVHQDSSITESCGEAWLCAGVKRSSLTRSSLSRTRKAHTVWKLSSVVHMCQRHACARFHCSDGAESTSLRQTAGEARGVATRLASRNRTRKNDTQMRLGSTTCEHAWE